MPNTHHSHGEKNVDLDTIQDRLGGTLENIFSIARPQDVEERDVTRALLTDVLGSINLSAVWAGRVQPLMHGLEEFALQSELVSAVRPVRDGRDIVMSKIAALKIPNLATHIGSLVSMRQNDEVFADWRHHLGVALDRLEGIGDSSDAWNARARLVVLDEMTPVIARANQAIRKSTAISAMTLGVTDFVLTALAATAGGLITKNLIGPTITAATGRALTSTAQWVRARADRRAGHAILDLSMILSDTAKK